MRLVVADVLFQDPTVPGTTFFATHRDTLAGSEVADVTVVVKLSHGQSSMQMLGCEDTHYPLAAGGYVIFRSDCLHRGRVVETPGPVDDLEHYKIAMFFKRV